MLSIAAGARRRQTNEHNARAWLAWNIVAIDRARRMPTLKSLMVDPDGAGRRKQTWQEQRAIARQLAGLAP
jgi:hypothetical protein